MSANDNKEAVWREEYDRDGRTYIIDHSGRKWYGTSAEVREAALMPWRRDRLAKSLKLQRSLKIRGVYSSHEFEEVCADYRRNAIQYGSFDDARGASITIPAAVYIRLVAGARLVKDTFDEYLADLWESEIDALRDVAQIDLGNREIPFTIHELAALHRLGADTSSSKPTAGKAGAA